MKIKSKPFRTAFGIGAIFAIVVSVARAVLFGQFSTMESEPPAFAMGIFAVVSIISFIVPILLGILYTHLARKALLPEETFGFEEGAIGGAAVGAAVRFLVGLMNALLPFLFLNLLGEDTVDSFGDEPQLFFVIALSLLFGIVTSIVGGIILGGLGGGVYAAIRDR